MLLFFLFPRHAREVANLMVQELVAAKGSHAGLDASRAQGNEDEAHHGERAEGETAQALSQMWGKAGGASSSGLFFF